MQKFICEWQFLIRNHLLFLLMCFILKYLAKDVFKMWAMVNVLKNENFFPYSFFLFVFFLRSYFLKYIVERQTV